MIISSIDNDKVKIWKKIRTKKFIDEYGLYIVEGDHLVEEAIKSNLVKELILLEGSNYKTELPIVYVTEKVMSSISLMPSIPNIMAVLHKNESNEISGNKIIMLDDIQDPGNVGTIIRSALAFDVSTVVLSKYTASVYNDKVIRASQGMIFHINIVTMDLLAAVNLIKSKNIKVYAAEMNGKLGLNELEKNEYAFILGNEGNGVKKELIEMCDDTVRIPINSNCESLNVGVSGGIIMYELRG